MNQLHKNLKFTCEEGTKTLAFLNVEIEINANDLNTWVYRKKTHTGVFLNYTAIVPNKWKFGLIMCLLHQAKVICSNDNYFKAEISKLREMF